MPLIQGKSNKAFKKNIEAEMHAGKPQKQALAIAYDVKRRNSHKKASGGMVKSGSKDMDMHEGGPIMYAEGGNIKPANISRPDMGYGAIISRAEGGEVNESAASEHRPMPEEKDKDRHEIARNSAKKALVDSDWTDNPTVRQAQKPSQTPLKHPKMVPQDVYSVRLRDEEDDLQSSARPGPYGEQPPKHDDEEGPNRQGPAVRDMEDEHSTHRKPYAKGGMIDDMHHPSKHLMQPEDDEMQAHERSEQMDHMREDSPSEDEGSEHAREHNEEGPNRQGPALHDMEDEHSTGRKPYAEGGSVQYRDAMDNEDMDMELNPAHDKHSKDDSEMQPEEEAEEEHHNSIAAAIMAKRRMAMEDGMSGSDDMNDALMAARGGEILKDSEEPLSHGSWHTHEDADQVDLDRNAEEDANEEDQMSFDALRKENYSESDALKHLDQPRSSNLHGDEEESESENRHDMIGKIRSRMNMRRQFR